MKSQKNNPSRNEVAVGPVMQTNDYATQREVEYALIRSRNEKWQTTPRLRTQPQQNCNATKIILNKNLSTRNNQDA